MLDSSANVVTLYIAGACALIAPLLIVPSILCVLPPLNDECLPEKGAFTILPSRCPCTQSIRTPQPSTLLSPCTSYSPAHVADPGSGSGSALLGGLAGLLGKFHVAVTCSHDMGHEGLARWVTGHLRRRKPTAA